MFLRQITDPSLAQNAYLIGCQRTGEAIIVDPERDVDRYLKIAADHDFKITAVADSHIHADYLSGTRELMEHHGSGSTCGKALGAVPTSVLGYERLNNAALREALEGSEDDFVKDILSDQPEPPRYFARMKRDNKVGPALLPGGKLPEPRRVQSSEVKALVNGGKHTFLDLRTDRVEL